MTETTAEAPAAPATATPKGKKAKAVGATKKKVAKTTPSHPPVAQMVNAAIKALKERGGSSTQAIKKYISSTYKIDAEKKSKFIGKYLKSAVASGALVQTKGKGASGSFKLAGSGEAKSAAAPKAKKTSASKPKKSPAKKTAAPKAKKTKKPPTAAKSPKPKVAKAKPASTPKAKKAAAPKKVKKPSAKKASPKKK